MFIIDSDKLDKITVLVNRRSDPKATRELIESELLASWRIDDDFDHQEYLDRASPEAIALWLASFYR